MVVNWLWVFQGGPIGLQIEEMPIGLGIGCQIINGSYKYKVQTYLSPELAMAVGMLNPDDDDIELDEEVKNIIIILDFIGFHKEEDIDKIIIEEERNWKLKLLLKNPI